SKVAGLSDAGQRSAASRARLRVQRETHSLAATADWVCPAPSRIRASLICSAVSARDTSTPAGRMMVQMLAVFAEFEREILIDRVISGMERKAARGQWAGGLHPYGYRVDPVTDKLIANPDEAPILREIFGLYATTRIGTRA